jgi:hypothetical protein
MILALGYLTPLVCLITIVGLFMALFSGVVPQRFKRPVSTGPHPVLLTGLVTLSIALIAITAAVLP